EHALVEVGVAVEVGRERGDVVEAGGERHETLLVDGRRRQPTATSRRRGRAAAAPWRRRGKTGPMAITGVHALLYTAQPEAVRAILRDVFEWKYVDSGGGWLIFALPPAELGVHPGGGPTFDAGVRHQLSLMCDDLDATVAELRARGLDVRGEPQDEGFGITTT